MNEKFEIDSLLQRDLQKYYDTEKKALRPEGRAEILIDVARMVRYDADFADGLLDDTLNYLKAHYDGLELWEENKGDFPSLETVTEKEFTAETLRLRENFSHKRVDWLKSAGKKLYGKPEAAQAKPKVEVGSSVGESRRQNQSSASDSNAIQGSGSGEQARSNWTHSTQAQKPTSRIAGRAIAIAVALIVIVLLILRD